LENDPVLADALRSALTAIRQVVTQYGPFFDGGQHTVQGHLIDPRVRIGKRTIPLAWQVENILIGALTSSERFRRACVNSDEGASIAASESEYTWIIDPIDGGRHVARGLPLFTISVSLLREGSSLLGVVFAPVTGELFFALKAKGAYLNAWENRLHVSNTDPEDAVLQVEFPNRDLMDKCSGDFEKQCESVRQIFSKVYRVRGLGLGSLGLAYVAKGAFDGYVTFTGTTLRNDVCAGLLLVEEAGGRVKEFEVPHVVPGNVRVLAANETVFRKIMAVVRR
jgi:myo-inositol-1(or 4)-monophosphatase